MISKNHEIFHDVSFTDGIQLDVFVYPYRFFDSEVHYEDFIQIFDGKIQMDTDGYGENLKRQVLNYIEHLPSKSLEELQSDVAWCEKMALRTERGDAEGMFRWHWLLRDSLEIFCDIAKYPYRGPKKSLRWMKVYHPDAFDSYAAALSQYDPETLKEWVNCLKRQLQA